MTAPPCVLLALLPAACDADGGNPDDTGGPPEDEPPVAVIDAPASAEAGHSLTLDGSGSYDPAGYAITAWDWACSDGTTASGATADLTFATPGTVTCTLVVTSQTGLTGSVDADIEVAGSGLPRWTLLVWMAGDNDLEMAALGDLNEMESVGSTDDVRIVASLDRSEAYSHTDGDWSGARRYLVEQDSDAQVIASPVLQELGVIDSGDPEAIAEFVEWGIAAYPAERYALVFWNHGWGWSFTGEPRAVKGVASDEGSGNDVSVAEGELEEVLDRAMTAAGGRLALLGMDACLMGSWEVAQVAAESADVFVASQATEGLDGWPWDAFLADLVADPAMEAATLGERIALRFHETPDSTMSVTDLARMDDFGAGLDALATEMIASDDPAGLLALARRAPAFDVGSPDHDLGAYLDLVAADAATPGSVATAATEARSAYDEMILADYTWGPDGRGATGLSLYTPTDGRVGPLYSLGSWCHESLWDDFLLAATGGR